MNTAARSLRAFIGAARRAVAPRILAATVLVAAAAGALPTAALAGRPCDDHPLTVAQIRQGMATAQATAEALDRTGAQVLLLARAGQDLSAYGLRWSHLGFVYRDTEASGKPVWRVLHKLNECGTARADLYRQGLGEFFMDRPYRFEGAYVVLKPALQQALLPLLRDNTRAAALHAPAYSMVAYPWSVEYQQSNQWVLETLASAAAPAEVYNRVQAQAWLRSQGYQPTDLHLSSFQRLGARIGMANVAFDDHPASRRFSGHIATTTVDSIFQWLPRAGWGEAARTVTPPP